MLSDYKEEADEDQLRDDDGHWRFGSKRNFSSRSQRRDAEELNVCDVVYGYIVSA